MSTSFLVALIIESAVTQHKYISFRVYLHIPIFTDEGFKASTTFSLLITQDFSYVYFN